MTDNGDDAPATVAQRIQARLEGLTRAERQLADALLQDYPALGLASITAVAQGGEVSTPTVVRMVRKLGFDSFGTFQEALRRELSATLASPIRKHERWAAEAPDGHVLNRFADAVTVNLRRTLAQVDPALFDGAAGLLADRERHIYVAGGRITRSLADYLVNHLQMMRPRVTELGTAPAAWPHHLIDLAAGDVVVLFDIRRYETMLLRLAEMAHQAGAAIVLFTDQWGSPIGKRATVAFRCAVEAPSAWDSAVAILSLVETLIAALQERSWDDSRARVERLEDLLDQTRLFRKFT